MEQDKKNEQRSRSEGNQRRFEIENERLEVNIMRERVLLYNELMELKNDKDEPLFDSEWLKKNILKINE